MMLVCFLEMKGICTDGVLLLTKSFLGAVLDTLLYVLKDGLLRLTNVRKLQCAKKCGKHL